MMVKRIGELEHTLANLIQLNKTIEERLDKHGARLYTLEQLDIPQQLFDALEKSINRDQSKELAHDLAEARKKKKKSSESPKMPPGSPSHQPPPPPPPAEDFQLGIESYQTQVNLTKPQWTATGFKYKHDYTVIESPRAVIFRDKYGVQMMMRFNEIHKFSDETLQQIIEALDYRVKEFRINRMNPEAFEDTENLPQPRELCWRMRQRGRLQTFEAYQLI
nr:hypothetical protein [Tanacetum cinerariifolium]